MISVITPCLNIIQNGREKYFHKMMQSVQEQTYKPIEHIVIDNESTDGTLDLLKEYERKGQIILIHEKKRGIYPALNKGLNIAKGKYINIMNSDDYFTNKNFFKKSIETIESKGVDFTHADRIIKSRQNEPDKIKKGNEKLAFFRMPFRHQTIIEKREIYDLGQYDENYKIASDYKHILTLLLNEKKGHYFPEVFVCSLDGGISSNREKCIEEVSQVIYEIYGKKYGLALNECEQIYLRKIDSELFSKIKTNITNSQIVESLEYCYKKIQPAEQ